MHKFALLLLASLALGTSSAADDGSDVDQRLADAERRIAELESSRADAIDDYLKEHPEAPRTARAGYDDGFFFVSADDRFRLDIDGQLQVRFLDDELDETTGDPHRAGFEMTRAKIVFSGHLFGKRWNYKVQGDYDFDGGGMILEDAWVSYWGDRWSVTAGQFKCPVLREEKVDSMYQLCVERSVVADAITSGERFQGVAAGFNSSRFRAWGAFTDGDGSANTAALMADAEYAVTFRLEYLPKGSFELFETFTSFPDEEAGILIAFSGHFQQAEAGTGTNAPEVFLLSFDFGWEFGGSNVFVQASYAQVDEGFASVRDIYAVVAQGGIFVHSKIELFARWEFGDLDQPIPAGDINIATIGANWYIERERIKLTADFGYAFDPVPVDSPYTGYRKDSPFSSGQMLLRIQLQILF